MEEGVNKVLPQMRSANAKSGPRLDRSGSLEAAARWSLHRPAAQTVTKKHSIHSSCKVAVRMAIAHQC
jgi:hypothetical protein